MEMDINVVNIFSDENILQVASQGLDPKQLYPFTDQLPESGIQRGSVFMGNPILRMHTIAQLSKAFSGAVSSWVILYCACALRTIAQLLRHSAIRSFPLF